MIVRGAILFLFLSLTLNASFAQESSNKKEWTIETILSTQIAFLLENFKSEVLQVSSINELDKLIQEAQRSWQLEALKNYNGLTDLLSPAYIFFIQERNPTGIIDDAKLKLIAIKYQIPAFIDEYKYLKYRPNYKKAILLSKSRNNFLFPHKYELPESLWLRFREIFYDMPSTISEYLKNIEFIVNDYTEAQLEVLRWKLIGHKLLWEIEACLYKGDFTQALE